MNHYDQLLAKVDRFFESAAERGADLRCGEGCTACCEVDLTLSPVEADRVRAMVSQLPEPVRATLRRRAQTSGRECVMLVDGRCAIYVARPLVCRSQGLPLAYPDGVIPTDSIRARGAGTEVTWCPLNFTERPPAKDDILAAGRLDEALALVNRAHCDEKEHCDETEQSGIDPLKRLSLREIALDP